MLQQPVRSPLSRKDKVVTLWIWKDSNSRDVELLLETIKEQEVDKIICCCEMGTPARLHARIPSLVYSALPEAKLTLIKNMQAGALAEQQEKREIRKE